MVLAEKYVVMFKKECYDLSNIILCNLNSLKENPHDCNVIENIIQAADTMKGNSRFINNKEIEKASMLLVKIFNHREKVFENSEIEFFTNLFTKIKMEQNFS